MIAQHIHIELSAGVSSVHTTKENKKVNQEQKADDVSLRAAKKLLKNQWALSASRASIDKLMLLCVPRQRSVVWYRGSN